ncbi:hypothetical protein [Chitinophaga flava]|uniref:Uncharacterized protein n=1 Tax=Chitinophaga flava TaxID=2259036 RepID=A0A365XZC4_9BACT|nr:hypothetical protein [Chitinophaga flava]RBL91683.1 hypothetical protein DF182_03470 [Chitinophaga flava]
MKKILFFVLITFLFNLRLHAQVGYPLCIPKNDSSFAYSTASGSNVWVTTTDTLIEIGTFKEKVKGKTYTVAKVLYYRKPWLPAMQIRRSKLDYLENQYATDNEINSEAPPPPPLVSQSHWVRDYMEKWIWYFFGAIIFLLLVGFRVWQKFYHWFAPLSVHPIISAWAFVSACVLGILIILNGHLLYDGDHPLTRFIYQACFTDSATLNAPAPTSHDGNFLLVSMLLGYLLVPVYLYFSIVTFFNGIAFLYSLPQPEGYYRVNENFYAHTRAHAGGDLDGQRVLMDNFMRVLFFVIPYLVVNMVFPDGYEFRIRMIIIYVAIFVMLHLLYYYLIINNLANREKIKGIIQPVVGYAAFIWMIFSVLLLIKMASLVWMIK